ncbi:MAG: Ribosome maturation factor RimP [Turneriella sp.]|nr:Ribosome maturation factor RimP [Turneriella sp.]
MNIVEITERQITERVKATLPKELKLHKITFFHSKGNMRIAVELDKPADPYGSVNIRECEAYSRALKESLDTYESTSGVNLNYSLEVSSAGAERELSSLEEVKRFMALPLSVVYSDEAGKVRTEVLSVLSIENEVMTFKLADCKWNRKELTQKKILAATPFHVSWNSIKKIRLHVDI